MITRHRITLAACIAAACTLTAGPVPTDKPEHYPDWWFERDVIPLLPNAPTSPTWENDYPKPDDHAVANIGQLKHTAVKAAEAMNHSIASVGGAGSAIDNLVADFVAAGSSEVDYTPANLGQLKEVARHFYERLNAIGYVGPPLASGSVYPWTGVNPDDYAMANLGQLKHLFSFDIQAFIESPDSDTDTDGIPDFWELYYFGDLTRDGSGDYDNDGLSDHFEYQGGGNPILNPDITPEERLTITYDVMGRVDAATAPFTMSFSFDDEGNLLSVE
ncbi:MAG: sugar-binding protein [Verrucomicrobiota bacterium]